MGVNAPFQVFLIFLYIINVNGHFHRANHILNSQSYGEKTDELQSVIEDVSLNTGRFKYLRDIKHPKKQKRKKYDVYNPVARFVHNGDEGTNTQYNFENLLNGNEFTEDMSDESNSDFNLPRNSSVSNVNHINSNNPTANNAYHLPNGKNQELQTQGNNPSKVPEASTQVNTGNLYVVPPRNTNTPLATIPIADTVKSDINNIPNYAIININGQPTLVQVINAPTVGLSNSVQTAVAQGANGQYILLQTSNVPITNVDHIGQKPDTSSKILDNSGNANNEANGQNNQAIKFNEQIRSDPDSSWDMQSAILQPGFVNSALNHETYERYIEPRK